MRSLGHDQTGYRITLQIKIRLSISFELVDHIFREYCFCQAINSWFMEYYFIGLVTCTVHFGSDGNWVAHTEEWSGNLWLTVKISASKFWEGEQSVFHSARPSAYQSSEACVMSESLSDSNLILHLFFGKGPAFGFLLNDWKRSFT